MSESGWLPPGIRFDDTMLMPTLPPLDIEVTRGAIGQLARAFKIDTEVLADAYGVQEADRLVREVLDGDVRRQIDETNRRLIARMSHPAFGPRRPAM